MQNFPMQGGSAPLQPPPGGAALWTPIFVANFTAPRGKQSWICGQMEGLFEEHLYPQGLMPVALTRVC